MELLQLTESRYISKEEERCVERVGYHPDKEIMKLISSKINCTLPWTEYSFEGQDDVCKTEDDFERYIKTIVKSQSDFYQVPPKCRVKTWTPIRYLERSTESEESSITIYLSMMASKVR